MSSGDSGAALTLIFMNAGLIEVPSMPRRHSPIHRRAMPEAVSPNACGGRYRSCTP